MDVITTSGLACVLFHNASRILVLTKTSEFCVTQVIAVSPFQKFDLRDVFGPYPNALLHVIRRKSGSPAAFFLFGKVHERATSYH